MTKFRDVPDHANVRADMKLNEIDGLEEYYTIIDDSKIKGGRKSRLTRNKSKRTRKSRKIRSKRNKSKRNKNNKSRH